MRTQGDGEDELVKFLEQQTVKFEAKEVDWLKAPAACGVQLYRFVRDRGVKTGYTVLGKSWRCDGHIPGKPQKLKMIPMDAPSHEILEHLPW